jgi:hypothetical protein
MSAPISYVTCPACGERFYIHRPDFEAYPDPECHCPFCQRTFGVQDGNPYPPVITRPSAAASTGAGAGNK